MTRGRAYGSSIVSKAKRTRRRPELGTMRWRRLRKSILLRDLYRCHWCGGPATEVDHVVPVSHGGDIWDPANLVACCARCNLARPTDAYSTPDRIVGVHKRTVYSARSTVLSAEGMGHDAALRPLSPLAPQHLVGATLTTTTGSAIPVQSSSGSIPTITGDYSVRVNKYGA